MWDFLEFLEFFLEVFVELGRGAVRDLLELRDGRPAKYSGPFGHFGRPFST